MYRAGCDATPRSDGRQESCYRIDALIEHLLTLAKLDSMAEAKPPMSSVSLNEVIESVAADARFEAERCSRSISMNGEEDIWVWGNEGLLRSAFENVIRNAVRYTQPDTSVEISAIKTGNQVEVCVRDHGPGIPDSALPHVFRPFFRSMNREIHIPAARAWGLPSALVPFKCMMAQFEARNAEPHGLQLNICLPLLPGQ